MLYTGKKLRTQTGLFFYPELYGYYIMTTKDELTLNKKKILLAYLKTFVSENKNNLFRKIINYRTKYITIVLEDIYQPHNASAVLRSCDCFGIQDVHIIENTNKYTVNPDVALGSSKWLNLFKYNKDKHNTSACLNNLKEQGYLLVATTPDLSAPKMQDLKLDAKIALLFGTELNGLSEIALKQADESLCIPMYGFTESLNISVSAALLIFYLTEKIRNQNIDWQLCEEEVVDVQLAWVRSVIKDCYLIEKKFLGTLS